MSIKIVTDSTSYLPKKLQDELDIQVVSLSVNFNTESFLEKDIDDLVFYKKMAESNTIPTSSQPSLQDFCDSFETLIKKDHAVVGIFLSAEMSGTYNTAITAKNMILERYPQGVIEIIDSRSNCMETGFAVLAAAETAQKERSLETVINSCYRSMQRSRFLFTPQTLKYLKKGGRIGGAQALLGTILQVKPILTVKDGKTTIFDKVRTKARAIERILNILYDDAHTKGLERVIVHHIDNEQEGQALALRIEDKLKLPVFVYPIGPVIGLHVGPGTIGVVYQTKEPLE